MSSRCLLCIKTEKTGLFKYKIPLLHLALHENSTYVLLRISRDYYILNTMKKFKNKEKYRVQQKSPFFSFTSLLLVSLSLSACSAPAPAPMPTKPAAQQSRSPGSLTAADSQALRVIVKFRQAVPFRDEAFLQEMSQKIHARMSYISSVSANTHVYWIELQGGLNQADALRSLAGIPSVQYAEPDGIVKAF